MAGPKLKQGLDYFPMATRNDSRYKVIRALHGDTGYVILNTLLQDIHGEKGYFAKWNDRLAKIFSHENGFKYEKTVSVVKDCFSEGIFDEELFHAHQILTSEDIQQVWINVAKERKEILFNQEYLLMDISPYLKDKKEYEQAPNSPDQTFPEEFLSNYEEEEPEVNSNNLPFNSNNPSDNRQGKEAKQVEEEKETNQAKEEKEESKRSEAFDFSHLAENNFPLEKPEEIPDETISEKKSEENFEKKDDVSENTDQKNSGKSEKPHQIDLPENSAEKISRNSEGKQEKLFENPKNSSSDIPNQENAGKKGGKQKRKPHPVRPQIISIWEKRFGQPYENSLDGNVAINKIIRHLEKLIRRAREGDIVHEEEVHQRIAELWKVLLNNWDKLEKFYRNLIRFESIAKYLTEIINQIKDYGINQKQSKSSNANGAKPSFERFRK